MADAGAKNLTDMFKVKSKKKAPKSTNLNANPAGAAKADEKKDKSRKQDDQWADEDDVGVTELKVQALENFKEEETRDDDNSNVQAWNNIKKPAETGLNERKYPSLAKALHANPKAMLEERDNTVKISKNAFDALGDGDNGQPKRSGKVVAALVTKAKGERQDDAVMRVKNTIEQAKKQKKRAAREAGDSDISESSEDEEPAEEDEAPKKAPARKKAPAKKAAPTKDAEPDSEEEAEPPAADTTMEPDLAAARAKYADRKRLPVKDLPFSELQETQKKVAEKKTAAGGGKKKKNFAAFDEEDDSKSKLQELPEGW